MTLWNTRATLILGLSLLVGCVDAAEDDALGSVFFDDESHESVVSQPIVGGQATAIASLPWQISLRSFGGHVCGGAILNASWILTAAHCVEGARASTLSIEAGSSQLGRGQVRAVSQVISHPSYLPQASSTAGFDIALLALSSPLTLGSSVAPIAPVDAAASAQGATAPGTLATVSGWGATREGGPASPTLRSVALPLVSNAQATQAYRTTIGPTLLAAGLLGQGGKDSCQGDSGGPLVVSLAGSPRLAGVVSFGFGCARPQYPGIYTRVESYLPWIRQYVPLSTPSTPSTPPPVTPPPSAASPITVTSSVSIPVPDGSSTQRSVTLTDTFALSTITLDLTLNHPYPSDLAFVLRAPTGQRVLLEQPGQNSSSQRSYTLTTFAGLSVSGQWTLEFYDVVTPDAGSVSSLRMQFNP